MSWLNVVSLLGAVQGFLLGGVLATKSVNRSANRLLAVLMATFSIYLFTAAYIGAGWIEIFPHFYFVSYPLPLVFGPLVYLYAVQASDHDRRFAIRDMVHFLPLIVVLILTLPIYLKSGAEKIEFYRQLRADNFPVMLQVINWLKYVSGVSYSVATIRHLLRHRGSVKDSYSSIEWVNLNWLLWLARAGAAIWAVATALQVAYAFHLPIQWLGNPVALGIALLVYGIGYMGLRQPEIFNFVMEEDEGARYERSGLGEREAAALKDALLAAMDKDRPYQDSALTLADLATRLNTTAHKLTEVLSQHLGLNFYDFVNGYRVEDVRRRVADARFKNLTLLALALDAGFASKSSFNNVFKKHTGQTPSEYRRALVS